MKKNRTIMVIALLVTMAFASCGMSKEKIQKNVSRMLQENLDTSSEYQRLQGKVGSSLLVKTATNENKYRGEIQVTFFGEQYKLSVSAMADKNAVLYELEPDALLVLASVVKKADAIKKDIETKTRVILQDQLNADAKYSVLKPLVKNAQLVEAGENYQGYAMVNAFNDDYKLAVLISTNGGNVQCVLSPEAVSTLDGVVQWRNDILAQGYAAYLGTWFCDWDHLEIIRGNTSYEVTRNVRNVITTTYTISAEEVKRVHLNTERWSDSYSNVYKQVQWRLVNDNTRYVDYNRFGYVITGVDVTTDEQRRREMEYNVYLHRTDGTKLVINGIGVTRK